MVFNRVDLPLEGRPTMATVPHFLVSLMSFSISMAY
jgi:hypothetical protein